MQSFTLDGFKGKNNGTQNGWTNFKLPILHAEMEALPACNFHLSFLPSTTIVPSNRNDLLIDN
jgi:hypothetical protein